MAGASVRFGDVGDAAALQRVAFDQPVDVVVSCLASRTGGKARTTMYRFASLCASFKHGRVTLQLRIIKVRAGTCKLCVCIHCRSKPGWHQFRAVQHGKDDVCTCCRGCHAINVRVAAHARLRRAEGTVRARAQKDSWAIDYQATANALQAARKAGAAHFVLLSAICVQRPLLEFQRAKLRFEAELQAAGDITYSIVRPTAFFKSLAGQVTHLGLEPAYGDLRMGVCVQPAAARGRCMPSTESECQVDSMHLVAEKCLLPDVCVCWPWRVSQRCHGCEQMQGSTGERPP